MRNIELRLTQSFEKSFLKSKQRLELLDQLLTEKNPYKSIKDLFDKISFISKDMIKNISYILEKKLKNIDSIESNLNAFSPLAVLDRGYAIVQNIEGKAIRNSKELQDGELVKTRLSSGSFESEIKKIKND